MRGCRAVPAPHTRLLGTLEELQRAPISHDASGALRAKVRKIFEGWGRQLERLPAGARRAQAPRRVRLGEARETDHVRGGLVGRPQTHGSTRRLLVQARMRQPRARGGSAAHSNSSRHYRQPRLRWHVRHTDRPEARPRRTQAGATPGSRASSDRSSTSPHSRD